MRIAIYALTMLFILSCRKDEFPYAHIESKGEILLIVLDDNNEFLAAAEIPVPEYVHSDTLPIVHNSEYAYGPEFVDFQDTLRFSGSFTYGNTTLIDYDLGEMVYPAASQLHDNWTMINEPLVLTTDEFENRNLPKSELGLITQKVQFLEILHYYRYLNPDGVMTCIELEPTVILNWTMFNPTYDKVNPFNDRTFIFIGK